MRVAMGSDHAGFALKEHLKGFVADKGHEVLDVGTRNTDSVDYPIYGAAAAQKVVDGEADLAILVCGTGVGIGIAANKVHGVRCAMVSDTYSALFSRLHNDANALAIGSRVVGEGLAEEIVDVWLNAEHEGGRHARRVNELNELDDGKNFSELA